MKNAILAAYSKEVASRDGATGPYKPTEQDEARAEIAAKYTDSELRHALVMRAAYERDIRKNPPKPHSFGLPKELA